MNKMKIKEWVCSFSGCDGGNLYADTWLCGIEWGGGNLDNYYEEKLPKEIKNGKAPINLKEYSWEESLKYPYGRSFAKLFIAIKGGKVENYKDSARWNGEDLFKANLYPIAFESTDHTLWHKYGVDKITDFETKHLFNTWCFFNRFPFFTQLRIKHKPKLIICTGINYLRDYLMFFGGTNNINELHTGTIKPKSGILLGKV